MYRTSLLFPPLPLLLPSKVHFFEVYGFSYRFALAVHCISFQFRHYSRFVRPLYPIPVIILNIFLSVCALWWKGRTWLWKKVLFPSPEIFIVFPIDLLWFTYSLRLHQLLFSLNTYGLVTPVIWLFDVPLSLSRVLGGSIFLIDAGSRVDHSLATPRAYLTLFLAFIRILSVGNISS